MYLKSQLCGYGWNSSGKAEVELDTVDDVADDDLGFDEVIVYAEALGALLVAFLTEGGQHDDLEIGRFGGVAQYVEHVEAADFGHHGVEQD